MDERRSGIGSTTHSYRVEIRRGDDWNTVHRLQWERTPDLDLARELADEVQAEEPAAEIRIIDTMTLDFQEGGRGGRHSNTCTEFVIDR